jgi:hypothetical protein
MAEIRWLQLSFAVEHEPPLEVRAEPDGKGGWRIRAERTTASEGTLLFGYLQADPITRNLELHA